MKDKSKKSENELNLEQKLAELTSDLQRTRADFENYRKRFEVELSTARENGRFESILKLLPIIDDIERAVSHAPDELKDNNWAQGVVSLVKNLEKSLDNLNIKRIDAKPGTPFNPDLHEAILIDENSTGDNEVIESELQAGYTMNGRPIRHAMVKVTRK